MYLTMPAEVLQPEFVATLEELDCREDSDHKVELLWSRVKCEIYLRITEKARAASKICIIPNQEARHAFLHPFLYIG